MDSFSIEDIIEIYKSDNKEALSNLYDSIFESIKDNEIYINTVNEYKDLDNIENLYKNENKSEYKLFFKVTNLEDNHKSFQYKDGLNFDINKFNPQDSCNGGGLYFCDIKDIYIFIEYGYGNYIRPIFVPLNIPYYQDKTLPNKYKAPALYLLPKIRLGTTLSFKLLTNTNIQNMNLIRKYMYKNNSYISEHYLNTSIYSKEQIVYANIKFSILELYKSINKILIKENKEDTILNQYVIICDNTNDAFTIFNDLYKKIFDETGDNIDYILPLFFHNNDKSIIELLGLIFKKLEDTMTINYISTDSIDIYKCKKSITQSLNIKFEDITFLEYIQKYNCIISGSYALKYFLNLEYEPNDIDVYIEFNKDMYDTIVKDMHIYKYIKQQKSPYMSDSISISSIIQIINVSIDGKNIQFIFVNGDIMTFIKDSFDFDFCTCSYNPMNNEFINDNKDNYFEGVIQKSYLDCINLENPFSYYKTVQTIKRTIKYINRGFYIKNLDELLNRIKNICFVDYI
jgi:hypothetical protein